LAQKINKLIAAIERLQGVPAHDAESLTQLPEFADLAKYKVFELMWAVGDGDARFRSAMLVFGFARN
jgi:hypothetical protein